MRIALLVLLISMVSIAQPAFGDDTHLRCKSGGLIAVGESKLEVVSKCGEPASKDTVERRIPGSVPTGYVTIEQWTYNFGPSDFIYMLEFQGSTLKTIKRGERGF